jgi:hypothetical protein
MATEPAFVNMATRLSQLLVFLSGSIATYWIEERIYDEYLILTGFRSDPLPQGSNRGSFWVLAPACPSHRPIGLVSAWLRRGVARRFSISRTHGQT